MSREVSTVYVIIIGLEILISNFQHKKIYTWKETFTTIYLSVTNGLLDLLIRGVYLLVLTGIYELRIAQIGNLLLYWLALFLFVDFQFYWLHRLEHYCRIFWAAHVTHHSAEHMNLTVGFRASVLRPLYQFMFFIPLAFVGFKPIDILLMYSLSQFWAVFAHTEVIRKMGWLEYLLVTPSHHRVHHASNTRYLDKNMGMVLIIWDKLFGTYQRELSKDEYEPIRYGLTTPLKNKNLFHIIFHEWMSIARDVKRKDINWKQRLGYIFGRPGWKHDSKQDYFLTPSTSLSSTK